MGLRMSGLAVEGAGSWPARTLAALPSPTWQHGGGMAGSAWSALMIAAQAGDAVAYRTLLTEDRRLAAPLLRLAPAVGLC